MRRAFRLVRHGAEIENGGDDASKSGSRRVMAFGGTKSSSIRSSALLVCSHRSSASFRIFYNTLPALQRHLPQHLGSPRRECARSSGRKTRQGKRRAHHLLLPSLLSPFDPIQMPITVHSNLSLYAIPVAYSLAFIPHTIKVGLCVLSRSISSSIQPQP